MTTSPSHQASYGWAGPSSDDPEVVALAEHLAANNGLRGLEICEPSQVADAVRIFDRDGFVVVADVLTAAQTDFLAAGVLDAVDEIVTLDSERHEGNRGSHRYSFGGTSVTRSMLHRPEWQMLLDLPTIRPIVAAIFGSEDYMVRAGSGDFCLPGAVGYQPLHSDMRDFVDPDQTPFSSFADRRGLLTTRELPCPYLCVNFLPFEQTRLNGPTRQIPGTQHARVPPPTLDEEPEWMRLSTVCPAPAGAVQIRDVRAWHGGTPNLSDRVRAIPNLELYAPWFREPTIPGISYEDHQKLSPHGQHITRYVVQDSSVPLRTEWSFTPYGGPRNQRSS